MEAITDHTAAELRTAFEVDGLERYRADQVLRWLYQRGTLAFSEMTNLRRDLRDRLATHWRTTSLVRSDVLRAADGTIKLLHETADGARIETVIIPEEERRTVCISSQIGCSLDCRFCATGRLGLGRNLRPGEIVDQWLSAAQVLAAAGERPTHVVFMGMGEPLLNPRGVFQALRILTDPEAGALASRRITVSTAGVVPRLAALGEAAPVRLAISLHATTDRVRDELVPINRRFPIEALLDACRRYPLPRRDRISFEYILIDGVNDAPEDADRLQRLLRGIRAKINLIPMNEHDGAPYRRPDPVGIERFVARVARGPVPVSLRRSRGDDILAACGQLGALAQRGGASVSGIAPGPRSSPTGDVGSVR